ncbi:MAG TPA: bifunctional ADP-dependent NAD(P)H-hydrate dehydratase/NAD(P)H-hydrate epimerase, partial [Allosphingosinicella sp.]|nr:bifunctional ADP-dependent NAD(P)H-hydrate dehydratase/NAD(P)H-hydrate epimerase [Allosphingosinicella sp.]
MLFERPILTAAEMRAAEQRAIDAGASVESLMERAGAGAAEAIWRYAEPLRALILCGPGNNGGDGHVVARLLRERGVEVDVATLSDLGRARPAPLLVDALFGTGLSRGLKASAAESLLRLAGAARIKVAIDLPSGVSADDGAILSPVPDFDLTVTFGAPKPAHFLQPAARHVGRLVVADIGVEAEGRLHLIGCPQLAEPTPDDHKYSRGYVAVIAGEMPGAAALAAGAAAKAGAGYVRLIGEGPISGVPQAVVQGRGERSILLSDQRIGAVALGPGLGRSETAKALLEEILSLDLPLVLDADALWLMGDAPFGARQVPILTPHAGEFARLFGRLEGSKVEQARQAAARKGAVIL